MKSGATSPRTSALCSPGVFSAEVATGSAQNMRPKQKDWSPDLIQSDRQELQRGPRPMSVAARCLGARTPRRIMTAITMTEGATWAIAALATGGVIARPWRWPEAVWAVLG